MMSEAKSRFFANWQRDMVCRGREDDDDEEEGDENDRDDHHPRHYLTRIPSERSTTNNNLDIEFSITESGRTVAHMVTQSTSASHRSVPSTATVSALDDDEIAVVPDGDDDDAMLMDFSVTQSGRSIGTLDFTESERAGALMDTMLFGTAATQPLHRSNASLSPGRSTKSEQGMFLEGSGSPHLRMSPNNNHHRSSSLAGGSSVSNHRGGDVEGNPMELTESDRGVLLEAFGPADGSSSLEYNHDAAAEDDEYNDDDEHDLPDPENTLQQQHSSVLQSVFTHNTNPPKQSFKVPPPPKTTAFIIDDEKKMELSPSPPKGPSGLTIPVPNSGDHSASFTSASSSHQFSFPHHHHQQQPQQQQINQQQQQQQHQPNSSYGSSGSAFLSSVLNPHPGNNHSQAGGGGGVSVFSHTPPVASSFEVAHFGKRPRSGSVSGKLRSASDYLEEKGLLDRQTKGILNDLFIIGDEEMQRGLDQYEAGDPTMLEEMIRSGALLHRLPQDLDILGGLDFDFLTVQENNHHQNNVGGHMEAVSPQQQPTLVQPPQHSSTEKRLRSQPIPMQQPPQHQNPQHHQHQRLRSNSINPSPQANSGGIHQQQPPPQYPHFGDDDDNDNDDGIGELDFAGDFVSDQTHFNLQHHLSQPLNHNNNNNNNMMGHHQGSYTSDHQTVASPTEMQQMTEYERRHRSNSMFSALFNETRQQQQPLASHHPYNPNIGGGGLTPSGNGPPLHAANNHDNNSSGGRPFGDWMQLEPSPSAASPHCPPGTTTTTAKTSAITTTTQKTTANTASSSRNHSSGIQIAGRKHTGPVASGLTTSLEADKKKKEKEKRDKKKLENASKKKTKQQQEQQQTQGPKKKERRASLKQQDSKRQQQQQQQQQQSMDDDNEHISGCGRPRSPSDPTYFKTSTDPCGLLQVERPDGWVGAYSPESRKARLERFLEKRKHRVWTQGVKYDVRKNFAESRLRVKGRFVKKEDELMMRELMSIT